MTLSNHYTPMSLQKALRSPNLSDVEANSIASLGSEALPYVIDALRQANSREMIDNATSVLSRMGEPAVEPLIELLEEGEWPVSIFGVFATIGYRGAIPLLIAALDDKSNWTRWSAAEALIKLPSPDAIDALIRRLKDRDSLVRYAAVQALASIGDPIAVPSLTKMLVKKSLKEGEKILIAQTISDLQAGFHTASP
ncbi:MAG TPA: HEAT repeat domain-containing protein [Capsulimonadaceae bacterium]|jgi:HEAT repeat protein